MNGGVAGIVLAGGQSRRMGRDKVLMPYKGRPLIDHMIALLQQVPTDDVIISGDVPGYDAVPDAHPDGGPARALADIVNADKTHAGFLIVPVDMPALSPEPLRLLMDVAEGAYFTTRPMPAYTPNVAVKGNIDSMRDLLDHAGARAIDLPDSMADEMINVNTPEEWQSFTEES